MNTLILETIRIILLVIQEVSAMSITPAGGWDNRGIQIVPEAAPPEMIDGCPRCHSSEWKAASLVYSECISVSRGRIKGSALGAGFRGGQLGAGGAIFRGRTSGRSQTALSAMAAPPRKRTGLQVLLGILIFGIGGTAANDLVAGNAGQNTIIEGLITATLLFVVVRVHQSQRQDHDDASLSYENTRVCQRCGTFYEAPW
jgi:hypothetical protein